MKTSTEKVNVIVSRLLHHYYCYALYVLYSNLYIMFIIRLKTVDID